MMDTKKKQELIDNALSRVSEFGTVGAMRWLVEQILAGAPVVEAAPTWISVDERLPEAEVMVLICGALRDSSTGETYINRAIHSGGDFYSDEYRDEFHSVTHWMPLPAAPAPGAGQ